MGSELGCDLSPAAFVDALPYRPILLERLNLSERTWADIETLENRQPSSGAWMPERPMSAGAGGHG